MPIRLRLFVISYAPMFAIVVALHWPTCWVWSLPNVSVGVAALLAIVGLADAINLVSAGKRVSPLAMKVVAVQDAGSVAAGYAATYLFPFLSVNLNEVRSVVAYLMFLGVLLVVSVRSPLGLVSPTLYLLGWRVFLVQLAADEPNTFRVLLAPNSPSLGEQKLLQIAGGYRTTKERHSANED